MFSASKNDEIAYRQELVDMLVREGLPPAEANSLADATLAVIDNAVEGIMSNMTTQVTILGVDPTLLMAAVGNSLGNVSTSMLEAAEVISLRDENACKCLKCRLRNELKRELTAHEARKVDRIIAMSRSGLAGKAIDEAKALFTSMGVAF
jgi:hypothetical protein